MFQPTEYWFSLKVILYVQKEISKELCLNLKLDRIILYFYKYNLLIKKMINIKIILSNLTKNLHLDKVSK